MLDSCVLTICLKSIPAQTGMLFLFSDHGKKIFVDPKEKILIGMRESFLRQDSLTEGERNKLF